MAHELTAQDNLFTVREPAWHGLGEVLPDHPTREEAQRIAHPWEPITEPVYRMVPEVHRHTPDCYEEMPGWSAEYMRSGPLVCGQPEVSERFEKVEDFQAVVRSDTSATLGVVTDTYEPVTNHEMYEIAEAIQGEGVDVKYETGGSLKGGRKVWLLLRLDEPLLMKGDPNGATIPYYSLQNAHDGSGSFRGQATMTRVVCQNTALMADMDAKARGTEFTFRHTSGIRERIEEARTALAGWRESVETWQRLTEHMLDLRITPEGQRTFIREFIPMPPENFISERVRGNITRGWGELQTILDGPTCYGIDMTAHGLVAAAVEYSNHYRRANSRESRFKRTFLDRSRLTSDAMELAQLVAKEHAA